MKAAERSNPLHEAVSSLVTAALAQTWTALPGVVVSYDATKQTAVIQPTIAMTGPTGETMTIPNLPDVLVQFPSGGGVTLTFGLTAGDEGLIVFTSRCLDSWWQSGGVQPQAEPRMHDLSDGVFIPGVRSQPRKLSNVSTTATQLRTDDGAIMLEIAAAGWTLKGPGMIMGDVSQPTGNITSNGTIWGKTDVRAGPLGTHLTTHVHTALNTPPTPGS